MSWSSYGKSRDAKLGMPTSTACTRLKKAILFSLVQETGRDICYRCGKKIETVAELSIEHKIPWLGKDVALFWDLSNIAYSHLDCNVNAGNNKKKVKSPPGQSWCSTCREHKLLSEFYRDRNRGCGVRNICKKCAGKQYKEWWDNKAKVECGNTVNSYTGAIQPLN